MEILHNINYLWLIAGAVLVIFEFMLFSGIGFLFAGLAALTVGALAEMHVLNDLTMQWVVFFIATLVWTLVLWKPLKNYKLNQHHQPFSDVVGQKAILITPLAPGQQGRARWSGTIMNAKLDANNEGILAEGAEVHITRVEGNVLIVK